MSTPADSLRNHRILIVDDEPPNVSLLERILRRADLGALESTTDSRQAIALYESFRPDLILLDLNMPAPNGFEVMEALAKLIPAGTYLPILVLTADVTKVTKDAALAAGAHDFLTKPFDQTEVILRIRNLLRTRDLHLQLREHKDQLEELVAERTRELEQSLTRLRETQQQVVQQERLRALGLMAGGVVHDFNNALAVILGFGELLARQCKSDAPASSGAEYAQAIVTAALDGAEMINRLRDFYRPSDIDEVQVPVDLRVLLEQAVTITQPKWRTQAAGAGISIAIQTELEPVPPILGNPAELREVMTNLIFNAVDAMPKGGAITIRMRPEGNCARIDFIDTGTGMTEEVRRRCLEPYFTTKGEKGTGLGLAMVYGILERHGATVEIESAPGKGTAFIIRLPLSESALAPAEIAVPDFQRPCTILVAEDQAPMLQILSRFLEHDCHTVEVATNGKEAMEKLRARAFDLLITDQSMPMATGEEVAACAKAAHPGMKVILLTGFGDRSGELPPGVDLVVGKPVAPATLRQAIARVSAERS